MPRVILVEDDEAVREVMTLSLEAGRFDVSAFATGEEGIGALDDGLDVLVTDLRLAGANGLEVARAARARLPDLAVLVVSGNASDAEERELDAEAIELLRKPFGPEALREAVARARTRSRALAEGGSVCPQRA